MKRRNFIKNGTAAVALTGTGMLVSNDLSGNTFSKQGSLIHYVLFWLKPGLSESEVTRFSGFFEELKKIKTVRSLQYGRPAPTGKREVVDNSFTYSMIATFSSVEEHESYQKDQKHLDAIATFGDHWEKVVVHDTLVK